MFKHNERNWLYLSMYYYSSDLTYRIELQGATACVGSYQNGNHFRGRWRVTKRKKKKTRRKKNPSVVRLSRLMRVVTEQILYSQNKRRASRLPSVHTQYNKYYYYTAGQRFYYRFLGVTIIIIITISFIYIDVMDIYSRVCCTHTQTSVL